MESEDLAVDRSRSKMESAEHVVSEVAAYGTVRDGNFPSWM
jgi:hypothetical protein